MLDHFQFGGNILQLLAGLRTDPLPRLAAAGATFLRLAQVVLDPLARQGDAPAQALPPAPATNVRFYGRFANRRPLRGRLFQRAVQQRRVEQGQLIRVELLAPRTVAGPDQLRDVMLQKAARACRSATRSSRPAGRRSFLSARLDHSVEKWRPCLMPHETAGLEGSAPRGQNSLCCSAADFQAGRR